MPRQAAGGGASPEVACFTEHVMTMGLSPASVVAQRFANAVMAAFAERAGIARLREKRAARKRCQCQLKFRQ